MFTYVSYIERTFNYSFIKVMWPQYKAFWQKRKCKKIGTGDEMGEEAIFGRIEIVSLNYIASKILSPFTILCVFFSVDVK